VRCQSPANEQPAQFLQQRWSSEFHPHGELPSNSDEKGHQRLGKKHAAKEMRDLGLKVSTAPCELHE
jgi:hypothetical protein